MDEGSGITDLAAGGRQQDAVTLNKDQGGNRNDVAQGRHDQAWMHRGGSDRYGALGTVRMIGNGAREVLTARDEHGGAGAGTNHGI